MVPKSIQVVFKDGSYRIFPHDTDDGYEYTNSVQYCGSFAIIENVHGHQFVFPADTIKEIKILAGAAFNFDVRECTDG